MAGIPAPCFSSGRLFGGQDAWSSSQLQMTVIPAQAGIWNLDVVHPRHAIIHRKAVSRQGSSSHALPFGIPISSQRNVSSSWKQSFGLRRQAKRDAALGWRVRYKTSSTAFVGGRSQSAVAAWDRRPALCRQTIEGRSKMSTLQISRWNAGGVSGKT